MVHVLDQQNRSQSRNKEAAAPSGGHDRNSSFTIIQWGKTPEDSCPLHQSPIVWMMCHSTPVCRTQSEEIKPFLWIQPCNRSLDNCHILNCQCSHYHYLIHMFSSPGSASIINIKERLLSFSFMPRL